MKSMFSGGVSGSVLDQWFDPTKGTALFQKINHSPFPLFPLQKSPPYCPCLEARDLTSIPTSLSSRLSGASATCAEVNVSTSKPFKLK